MRMLERIDAMLNSRLFLRIASVVIAVLIWLYAAGERNAETVKTFEVSLEYRNLGVGLSLSDAPTRVNVQVSGARNILAAMAPQNLIATVDLRDLPPGRHTLPVTSLAPSGVRITTVTPPYAEVQVLRLIEKTLPVSLNMEGTFPEGVSLESSDLDPREVLLRGDEALLEKIQKVLWLRHHNSDSWRRFSGSPRPPSPFGPSGTSLGGSQECCFFLHLEA